MLDLKSTRRNFMSSLGFMAGAVTGAMAGARNLFAASAMSRRQNTESHRLWFERKRIRRARSDHGNQRTGNHDRARRIAGAS